MTSPTIPIFVNGRVLPASAGASLATVLGDQDPDLLAAVLGGAIVTDARALPVDPDAPVHPGAIYRILARGGGREATDA